MTTMLTTPSTLTRKITRAPQSITTEVLAEKYLHAGEASSEDVFERVARSVAAVESTPELRQHWQQEFLRNMMAGAIGAGRIMASAGAGHKATWINCFVQPIADASYGLDGQGVPGIYEALSQAGETLRRGGGVGYNFSSLRPKGAAVNGTGSDASGPCTFMDIFDTSCRTVMAAGSRRGAQMGILNIDHPDVLEFVQAKRTKGRWNNFNVSVGVTHSFMQALQKGQEVQLVHKARPSDKMIAQGAFQREDGLWVYTSVLAQTLWDTIMRSAYDYAEPGIVFLDVINRDNNLRYCETIESTNPCGEQPLPAYGCCDLGPIILPSFVSQPFSAHATFDMQGFMHAVAVQVRFLDNVLDGTPWPLPAQQKEAQSKRRIGVGFTGLGNALAMLGLRYDSEAGRQMAAEIARSMRDAAYSASVELARERGAFPLFDAEQYLQEGTFASRLPQPIKEHIRKHGLRNSHLLSIAPTGTVSLAFADNASNGIEPPFSLAYKREKRMPDGSKKTFDVLDHGLRVFLETLPTSLADTVLQAVTTGQNTFTHEGVTRALQDVLPASMVTALQMPCAEHLAMMGAVQPYIDSAISKTVNVAADYPFEDFKRLYLTAHSLGLKGCATYRPNETLGAVLHTGEEPGAATATADTLAELDPLRLSIESRPQGELSSVTEKLVYHTSEGSKSLYLSVSFIPVAGVVAGQAVTIERPIEVFLPAGQLDDAQQWVSAAMRMMSLTARDGRLPRALADMRKVSWDKGPVRCGTYTRADGTAVPRYHNSEVAAIAWAVQQILWRRGFLDETGAVVPALTQWQRSASAGATSAAAAAVTAQAASAASAPAAAPTSTAASAPAASSGPAAALHFGKECPECGAHAVIRKDGCEYCTSCGYVGACG